MNCVICYHNQHGLVPATHTCSELGKPVCAMHAEWCNKDDHKATPLVTTVAQFLEHCQACGGNWTQMLASGVEELWPDEYALLATQFTFVQVTDILKRKGVQL